MAEKKTETKASEKKTDENAVAAADAINTSGAPQQVVPDVDMAHPAVDADPRAGTSLQQNRIDFNDPNKDAAEAVAEALKDGSKN